MKTIIVQLVSGKFAVQKFNSWNGKYTTAEQFATEQEAIEFRRQNYGDEVERIISS